MVEVASEVSIEFEMTGAAPAVAEESRSRTGAEEPTENLKVRRTAFRQSETVKTIPDFMRVGILTFGETMRNRRSGEKPGQTHLKSHLSRRFH